MATTIRMGSFETNSSSTHALVMMNTDEYMNWKRGDIIYDNDHGCFITRAKAAANFSDFVHLNDANEFEANDPSEWTNTAVAEALNGDGIGDSGYYSAWCEDEAELNGVHAVYFEVSSEW